MITLKYQDPIYSATDKLIFKRPPPLIHCGKKSRSFNAKNFGSVGQRAAKLLAVKVWGLKKKSAASAIPAEVCASAIGLGLRTPGIKSFSKFDGQQLCSPLTYRSQIFSIERSIPISKHVKNFKRLAAFWGWVLPSQSDLIFIGFI